MLLAIDPGNDTGWAVFNNAKVLHSCGLGQPPPMQMVGDVVVIEKPQVYRSRFSKGDPNDLITLAIGVGRYVERYERQFVTVRLVLPHEWKGSLPKDVSNNRTLAKLSDAEKAVVDGTHGVPAGKRHNMLDAIGLGLYSLGR